MTQINNAAVSIKLEPETKARLYNLSKIKQRSAHWLMKQAITQYLEHEELEESAKQETMRRWQEVQQGLLVENSEVMNWLDSWGGDKEKEKP